MCPHNYTGCNHSPDSVHSMLNDKFNLQWLARCQGYQGKPYTTRQRKFPKGHTLTVNSQGFRSKGHNMMFTSIKKAFQLIL